MGFHVYDLLMRAEVTSAKEKSLALQLQVSKLEAQLEKQLELCKKHGAALKGSRKQLVRADALVITNVARVEELEGRLVVVEEEKARAEAKKIVSGCLVCRRQEKKTPGQ